jgi:hypothetical protein
MEKKFRALRVVGTLYKVLGVIILIVAIVGAIGSCAIGVLGGTALQSLGSNLDTGMGLRGLGVLGGALGGIISGLVALIAGGIGGLTLFATGEAIYLLIDLEENTRSLRHVPPAV